ncbi:MAG: D-Ala-D-Ala carboxypeptidase family metallohydrolase [Gemmatimonadaceae bacterium]|nr:D-Ala-D-Ala carboxypeptidase family metallohydrolase [Gemmatimonadaceae bacterium]
MTTPIWQQANSGTRGGLSGGTAGPSGTPEPTGRKRWLLGIGVAMAAALAFAGTDAPSDLLAGPAPEAARTAPVGSPSVRPADEAFGASKQLVGEPLLAVMMPFELKFGSYLNGYRIGHYPAEWIGSGEKEKPAGFIEVRDSSELDLRVSKHLRVRDFLTHDFQQTWPRYIALNQRIVDKLELVLAELGRRRGNDDLKLELRVHSGFRTPAHNSGVEGAARDSRHLYGDAADVAIDADGDGRFTLIDAYNVERAVDWIERLHPELVGGMGVYSSRRFTTPYVHIDARGDRKRWRG